MEVFSNEHWNYSYEKLKGLINRMGNIYVENCISEK